MSLRAVLAAAGFQPALCALGAIACILVGVYRISPLTEAPSRRVVLSYLAWVLLPIAFCLVAHVERGVRVRELLRDHYGATLVDPRLAAGITPGPAPIALREVGGRVTSCTLIALSFTRIHLRCRL